MTIGQALRAQRERRGLSLSRLAGLADVSKSVLANAEGDRKSVTVASLRKILETGLDMSVSAFFADLERTARRVRKVAA